MPVVSATAISSAPISSKDAARSVTVDVETLGPSKGQPRATDMYARTETFFSRDAFIRGPKRASDSAIVQFVFRFEKDSVAERKIDTSWLGDVAEYDGEVVVEYERREPFDIESTPEVKERMSFGFSEDVFSAGPVSVCC